MQALIRSSVVVSSFFALALAGAGCLGEAPPQQPSGVPVFGTSGSAPLTPSNGGSAAGSSAVQAAGAAASGAGSSGLAGDAQSLAGSGSLGGTGGAVSAAGNGAGGSGGSAGASVAPRGTTFCDSTPLNLGEMRLLTNEWTDPAADTCVFLDQAGVFGWKWTRGATGTGDNPNYPNYPELEFGINPWNSKGLDQSTTTLLPLQLKDIASASMTVDVLTDVGGKNTGWNLAFELWLSDTNPALGPANPKGELMVFLSNAPDYYPTNPETQQTFNDGNHDYQLYVSSDDWGTWGYYRQYRLGSHDGKFSGKLDIGKFLKHYIQDEKWDPNLWVTRFELGNEVYQNSGGTTTLKSVSFEVNGQAREAKTE